MALPGAACAVGAKQDIGLGDGKLHGHGFTDSHRNRGNQTLDDGERRRWTWVSRIKYHGSWMGTFLADTKLSM